MLGYLPHEVDEMDPDHYLSLVAGLASAQGHGRRKPKPTGEPGVARTLQPGDPHYRPPTAKQLRARAKFDAATEPTEADLAWVRAGNPLKTRDIRQATRWLKAKQRIEADKAGS